MKTAADRIYVYRCKNCRDVTYTVTVSSFSSHSPYRCCRCSSWLRPLHSYDVVTDADRKLAARCPVWTGIDTATVKSAPPELCSTCRSALDKDSTIDLSPAGKFCSTPCADKGVADYEAFMERVEHVYQEKPWLRPAAQEK